MVTVHVAGIDRMRALAALSVMLAHITGPVLPGLSKYIFTGSPAVAAFFVISGFCIRYPYVSQPLPVKAFYLARAIRILAPVVAAYVIVLVQIAISGRLAEGVRWDHLPGLYVLWSLICEIWYYALFPIFLALSAYVSWHTQWIGSLALSFVLVSILGSDQFGNINSYGPWLNWLVSLPSFLLGCVLAEDFRGSSLPSVASWRALVATMAATLYWFTLNTPIGYYLTMNVFAILVVFWMKAEINSAKESTWLDGIGRWSYSIFLFHAIAQNALWYIQVRNVLLVVPLALALCYLAYIVIEKPTHSLAKRTFRTIASQEPRRSPRLRLYWS